MSELVRIKKDPKMAENVSVKKGENLKKPDKNLTMFTL